MVRKPALAMALGCLLVALGLWAGLGLRVPKDADGRSPNAPVEPTAGSEPGTVELIDTPGLLLDQALGEVPVATRAEIPIPAPKSPAGRAPRAKTPSKSPSGFVSKYPRISARIVDAQGQPLPNRTLKLHLQASTKADVTLYLGRGSTDDTGYVEFRVSRSSMVGESGILLIEDNGSEAYAFAPKLVSLQIGIQDLGTLVLQEEFQREPDPLLQAWVVDLQGQPVNGVLASVRPEHPYRTREEGEQPIANVADLLARIWHDHRQVRTGPEGLLQVFGATADQLDLDISASGFRTHSGTYKVPQRALRIVLEREQWVHGTVSCDADIWSQASLEVFMCTPNQGDFTPKDWSSRTRLDSDDPEFALEAGPGAMELQIRDQSSSALLYRSALNLVPDEDLDLGTLDLRGRIRPFQIRFQLAQTAPGDTIDLVTCWVDGESNGNDRWNSAEFELDFSESGEASWSGFIPSVGARFEVWLLVGQYLAKWRTFDVLTVPDPLLVPVSVSPDDCSVFYSIEEGTVVPRSELKLDMPLDLFGED